MRYVFLIILAGCATTGTGAATPVDTNGLRARMTEARSKLDSYVGEARLTYFGPDGRVKGTATLAVKKPASLRYEIQGPHGGVIEAFATNGLELQLLDFKTNRFIYGPANPSTIDRLLSFAPLGMDASQWVAMLCGDLIPPENARAVAEDERVRVRWEQGGLTRELEVDDRGRAERALAFRGDVLVSEVLVEGRGERGLPDRLALKVPEADVDMVIRLRDLEFDIPLAGDVFRIDAPESAERIYLQGE